MAIHGDSARALAAIARFESFENSGIAGDIDRTLIGLARGNRQEALDSLQAIIDNIEAQRPDPGISALPLLRVNFVRDPVLDEPEFVDLREQLRGR